LTVISGVLGMNVAGIPFSDQPWAFAGVCAVLFAIAVGLVVWMRKLRWL